MPEETVKTEEGLTPEETAALDAELKKGSGDGEGKDTAKEESFAKGIDPEKLPEPLKPLYKSMQADYTRGKQDLAQRIRDLEGRSKESEAVRQSLAELRAQNQSLQEKLNDPDYLASKIRGREPENDKELEPWQIEMRKEREQRQAIERRLAVLDSSSRLTQAENVFEKMKEGDPTFATYEEEMIRTLGSDANLRQSALQDPEGTYERLYGRFLRRDRDKILDTERKAERERTLKELKEQAQQATQSRTSLGGGGKQTQNTGGMTLEEAYAAAVKQHTGA